MKMIRLLPFAVIAAVTLSSCKKDDDNNGTNNNGTATAFQVRMTDAPGNYSGMNLQVTKVEAYIENQGWVALNSSSQNVSVLDLTNGSEMVLANDADAQVGHYTQIRLTMGTANTISVTDQTGDHTYDLNWMGNSESTITVDIDRYVNNGTQGSVLLDFNVAQSVSGDILNNYSLLPVITWIEDEYTGVKGQLTGASRAAVTFVGNGHTYTTYIAEDGKFMIRGMANGTYNMMVNGMHEGQNTIDEMTMSNVVVAEGQITNMGTITFN